MDGIIPQLHEAARNNEADRTKDLLRRFEFAPQMAVLANGLTPAHVAALSGSIGVLKTLVDFSEEDRKFVATAQDKQGLTVLHYAALGGDPDIVEYIISEFGESAAIRNNNGGLPIHFAAGAGHLEVLRKLVTHSGAHFANDKDNTGTTPAYFCAQEGHLECFKYLCIEAYADKLSRAGDGMTTLHGATQGGHFETVKWIVQQMGPKIIEDRADDGATPVHFAAASGHEDILAYFLQQGTAPILVDARDNENATPTHDAVEYGHLKSLKVLVQFNADLTAEDDEGESPYTLALKAPQDDPIYIFVSEYMRLAPTPRPRHIRTDSEPTSIVSHSDTSGHRLPKTSRMEATEIKQAATQATQILTHRTKHEREAADRMYRERKKSQKKGSLDVTKNRILEHPGPKYSLQYSRPIGQTRKRSSSEENILDTSPVAGTRSDPAMLRMMHHSHMKHRPLPSAYRRPYGYMDTEDLLLDKFVTHGYGVPPPPVKNLKHAKRVDLSQVSELVKRRESIRTRKDVYIYRQKQLRKIVEQSLSKKKILKYEDIQKKLDTPSHVADTFEPPAPPITYSPNLPHGGTKWDQYIETDSNPDSVDERYNVAAGIEFATLALLAPSCLSAFTSSLPEETFVALEGRKWQKEKGIKLGKMKTKQRQVGALVDEYSDQSDDPFTYDDIEARRRGWDEIGATSNTYPDRKGSKHFIGGEDTKEPGNIIAPKEKIKGKKKHSVSKGLSSLRKKVTKSKQTPGDSGSESSLVSYASDGEPTQEPTQEPISEPISELDSVVVESNDAPLFASPARRISVDYGQEGELTPKADTPTQFKYQFRDFNEKYKQEEKKIYKAPQIGTETFIPPPPLSEPEAEPKQSSTFRSPILVSKEETAYHITQSGVTRTTDSRRKNVSIPVKKESTTPAVVTKANVIELPSGSSSDSCPSDEETEHLIGQTTADKPEQLIGQTTDVKPKQLIGQITADKPKQLIGQITADKPKQLIGQITADKPKQLIGQTTADKPKQLIGQTTADKPKQLIGQTTAVKPKQLIGQTTADKSKQLIGQTTADKPKQLIGQTTADKPKQLIGQTTAVKPKQLIGQTTADKSKQLIGQTTADKPKQLIGREQTRKSNQLIGQATTDEGLQSSSNDDLNAILEELDLIGFDLQMELDGISDVTTPPTQSRTQSRQMEPKISKPEPKVSKPEPKVSKPEPKVSKPEPKVSKPEPKWQKSEPKNIKSETFVELEPKVSSPVPIASRLGLFESTQKPNLETPPTKPEPTIDSKNRSDPFRSKVSPTSDRVSSGEQRGRARGGRTPGGLKLSYNAENNYPESMDGSSIVSSVSKQGSELQFQIEKHTKLVDQASVASQIHFDKQTEIQLQLSKADDLVRKRSYSCEQAQMHLRKVSVSLKQPQLVAQARERADQSQTLLEEAKLRQKEIRNQLEIHVQQLNQLQDALGQMIRFKGQQSDLLTQIKKEGIMDSDTIQPTKEREDTPPRRKPPPAPLQTHQEDRITSIEKQVSDSSSENELIPPAESWKLISETASMQASNTDITDTFISGTATFKNLNPELKSGQITPRTLELTESARGHISIASLKRRGDKRSSHQSEPDPQQVEKKTSEPTAVRKLAVFHGKEEFCVVCELRVYPTEQFMFEGKIMHRSCIKCSVCKCRIQVADVSQKSHKLFCINHLPSS